MQEGANDTTRPVKARSRTVRILCEICREHIANVDPRQLAYPMRGSMFLSPDPHHEVPAPFPEGQTWEFFKCPWGGQDGHRPFQDEDRILSDYGYIYLPGAPVYEEPAPAPEINKVRTESIDYGEAEKTETQIQVPVAQSEEEIPDILVCPVCKDSGEVMPLASTKDGRHICLTHGFVKVEAVPAAPQTPVKCPLCLNEGRETIMQPDPTLRVPMCIIHGTVETGRVDKTPVPKPASYKCEWCEKEFKSRAGLVNHIKIHAGQPMPGDPDYAAAVGATLPELPGRKELRQE